MPKSTVNGAIRTEIRMAKGWRFHQGDVDPSVITTGYGDAGWSVVSVPHSWNRAGFYKPDPASHLQKAETVNTVQGRGWYRRTFTAPGSLAHKRAWLQFDAASRTAEVWLNGIKLGEHRGGFSRFRLDATRALRLGQPNVLVVKTDNTSPAPGSAIADVLPLTGDFFVHGGLYRPVSLVATDPVHIDLADFGGSGVYASTRTIAGGKAVIDVRARLRNDGGTAARPLVRLRLIDAAGAIKAESVLKASLGAASGSEVTGTLSVATPHLWQGAADPYLYRLAVDLVSSKGTVLDRVEQPFGIREIHIDAQRGLFLNGKRVALHGVGYHQDREGKGWAIDEADVAADMAILREMGANTIRLTHYQHGQTIHDLADRYGLIVWDEIPLVSAWTLGDATAASPALRENARQQLRELIRQNYNHPSVATWGIANEVDFGNAIPAFLGRSGKSDPPDPLPLLHELDALARAEDPSRPDTLATCCEDAFPPAAKVPITAGAATLSGANRYFGWYYGRPEEIGPHLDRLHARRPEQPLAVTEYGAGGATTIHSDDVLGGAVDSRGVDQPEEYQSYVHERNWAALKQRPYLWATWLWNSFDFASTARTEGDAKDINTKGLVTYDRAIRKDAYYFYKANWTDTPTLHITSRRYVDRAYRVTTVRAYSNADATELVVNGVPAGTRAACPDRICVWNDVALSAGTNSIVAKAKFASGPVEDRVAWTLAADAVDHVRIDSGALVAATATGRRFGSDAFFEGGVAGNATAPAGFGPSGPAKKIVGTPDAALAATYREGTFGYRVPLLPGRYTVTLTFVEPQPTPGGRRFDVTANGAVKIRDLDVAAAAGGALTALRRQFDVEVSGGALELRFVPSVGKAIVSAIEITR
jgi:beta-galactosidase